MIRLPIVGSCSARGAGIPLSWVTHCAPLAFVPCCILDMSLLCPGCTPGPRAPFHWAAVLADGPGSSSSASSPGLCPVNSVPLGPPEPWTLDQQTPPLKPSHISEDFVFSSFQQEVSALPTEAPEEMEPFPTPQEAPALQPEDPKVEEPSFT